MFDLCMCPYYNPVVICFVDIMAIIIHIILIIDIWWLTHFWNNLHQVCAIVNSLERQIKSSGTSKPYGLNRIAKISYICLYFLSNVCPKKMYIFHGTHLLIHEGYIGLFWQWSPFYIFLSIRILRVKATKMMVCINVKHTSYVIISTDTLFLECMYILCFNVVDISGRNQTLGKYWSGQESLVARYWYCWT